MFFLNVSEFFSMKYTYLVLLFFKYNFSNLRLCILMQNIPFYKKILIIN